MHAKARHREALLVDWRYEYTPQIQVLTKQKPPGFAGRFCVSQTGFLIRRCRSVATTIRRGVVEYLVALVRARSQPGQGLPPAQADCEA